MVFLASCTAYAQTAQTGGTNQAIQRTEKIVSLDLRDAPIQSAIRMLFEGTGLSYSFGQGTAGTVNMRLIDVPFTQALDKVMKAGNLQVRQDSNVYIIEPKKAEVTVATPAPDIRIDDEEQIDRKLVLDKITVGYTDAYDMLTLLNGGDIRSSNSLSSGFGNTNSGSRMNTNSSSSNYSTSSTRSYSTSSGSYGTTK